MAVFNQLQNKVFQLISSGDTSVSSHINLASQLSQYNDKIPEYFRKIKVAFLSNFTLLGLPEVFKIRGIFQNLWIDTYLGPYNQSAQEILNPESGLNKFEPKLIYFILDSADEQLSQFHDLALKLRDKTGARVVFLTPRSSSYGNNEHIWYVNFHELIAELGLGQHWNTKYRELGDFRLAPDAFSKLADNLIGKAVAVSGATKKCLVVDLDNTLWDGVVGEDGLDGIKPNRELQKHILNLYDQGAVLAINSKNNFNDAMEVFEKHPDMILRKNHFAAWRINWQDKSLNINELADELMLGSDSFVFVDDSPFEQNILAANCPEVAVLNPQNLKDYSGFSKLKITEEDTRRGQMYVEERTRKELQSSLGKVEDFLQQLNLEVSIKPVEDSAIARASQLTQKTNQFNLTTRRYSEEQIKNFLSDDGKIWTIQAKDRFGDYGIIGLAMLRQNEKTWQIENFLMSCRVLGRGLENAFLTFVLEQAKNHGAAEVAGEFIPTAKNKLCEPFYKSCDFKFVENKDNRYVYKYDLRAGKLVYPKFITLV